MSKPTDMRITSVSYCYLPVEMRMPLKFGAESVSSVNCIRVAVKVEGIDGRTADGWGETPLSVTWAWPSATMTYAERYEAMTAFCDQLAGVWANLPTTGHPLDIGHAFVEQSLPAMLDEFNASRREPMPELAALIAASAFDLAAHDAFGMLHEMDTYDSYGGDFLSADLSHYLTPQDESVSFAGKYPSDFLISSPPQSLSLIHI